MIMDSNNIESKRSKKLVIHSKSTARNAQDTARSSVSSINSIIVLRVSWCVLQCNNKNSNKPVQHNAMRILRNLDVSTLYTGGVTIAKHMVFVQLVSHTLCILYCTDKRIALLHSRIIFTSLTVGDCLRFYTFSDFNEMNESKWNDCIHLFYKIWQWQPILFALLNNHKYQLYKFKISLLRNSRIL